MHFFELLCKLISKNKMCVKKWSDRKEKQGFPNFSRPRTGIGDILSLTLYSQYYWSYNIKSLGVFLYQPCLSRWCIFQPLFFANWFKINQIRWRACFFNSCQQMYLALDFDRATVNHSRVNFLLVQSVAVIKSLNPSINHDQLKKIHSQSRMLPPGVTLRTIC